MTNHNKIEAQVNFLNSMIALFCQPEDDKKFYLNLLSQLKESCDTLFGNHVEADQMKEYLKHFDHQSFLVDYTKSFLGPYETIAHPYSSVYLGDGSLNGPSTMWVNDFYRLSGYKMDENIKDLPDHIAVELEFLYTLKFDELSELKNNNSEKVEKIRAIYDEFFLNHFRVWVPLFCNRIIEKSDNSFYVNLCKALILFVKSKN